MRFHRPRVRAVLFGSAVVTASFVQGVAPAQAATNLVKNPKLETMSGKLPKCWTSWQYGSNKGSAKIVAGHGGKRAVQITQSVRVSGARALIQTPGCAIKTSAGQRFNLSFYMKSSTSKMSVMFFRQKTNGKWVHWGDLGVGAANTRWHRASVTTGGVPAGTKAVRFGLAIAGKGSITTDDYSLTKAGKVKGSCTDVNGCTRGKWKVVGFGDPVPNAAGGDSGDIGQAVKKGVRAMHTVLLNNGKVLLIAGSGNNRENFDAGRFTSWLYDPATGKHKVIPTPIDMFCAGHVQLPDGRVLVVSGTKKYPTYVDGNPNPIDGWQGSEKSYLFDPRDNKYHRVSDMNDGHWYPSATIMGNGDVYSVGGYAGQYNAGGWQYVSRVAERFKYNKKSATGGAWLKADKIVQPGINWATYPSLILMQDGRLFYSGSSVFGHPIGQHDDTDVSQNQYNTGPGIFNDHNNKVGTNATWAPVGGLRDINARDQSAAVLLPPAQRQKVMVMGGMDFRQDGNTAHAHTDIVDLNAKKPVYKKGPDLKQAKTYVSAVLLPDGTVFETGGSYQARREYVREASVFNPAKPNAWTSMAADPVGRTYHNTAILLPDGRVLAAGSNPASNFYETRISIYSPTYLYKGARPKITGVDSKYWAYGSTHTIKTNRTIKSAWLMRPGAVTHSSDPNQRAVAPSSLKIKGGTVRFKLTNNGNVAPPGWYMLFATDSKGVPSVAKWIHVG
ncbi:galactose oxidase early set domain-containing protein [Actinocorallia longicatena]|uniref:Galactose oxidase-like Early set domain-containing protein n=1 Tax=Actinocorallia longicatena TaxID=111803 RepID=A0ABP6QP92_9ACTN